MREDLEAPRIRPKQTIVQCDCPFVSAAGALILALTRTVQAAIPGEENQVAALVHAADTSTLQPYAFLALLLSFLGCWLQWRARRIL